MAAEKRQIDWEAIEPEWRAGIKTKLQLSEEFGVSRAAIDKHFAKAGIERDLKAKIRAKTDALVTQDAVTREVTPETKVSERELIEANAQLQVHVLREQKADISRSRKLAMSLLKELEATSGNLELFEQIQTKLAENETASMSDLFRKVTSLGARTGNMKALAETLKTLVALERQAFGIDEGGAERGSIDDLIKSIK